ncbi:uncharacterized protein VTP21DRAFT_7726 [Calcarisporiella thermophila]|uniref:uncharacterized protein n=1 Tax=Calcarisporiella thermophila TaxID=911321 RepID=UPI0037428B16
MADNSQDASTVDRINPPSSTVPFFKKRNVSKNIRKRPRSPSPASDDDSPGSNVVVPDQKSVKNPLIQSTKSEKKTEGALTVSYQSSGTALMNDTNDATRYVEIDTEFDRDARALLEKKIKLEEETQKDDLYRGQAAYKSYIVRREPSSAASGKMRAGPIRAPQNIRVTSRFDYQPDICKDYKETGFCGYGDSCKFLHDRGDYKSGWQLDQEWEALQARLKRDTGNPMADEESSDESSDEELPFACLICRKEFTRPIVTKCGHYFCEACALKNYKISPKCFACGAATGGVFSTAKNLVAKLEEKKLRMSEKGVDDENSVDDSSEDDSD